MCNLICSMPIYRVDQTHISGTSNIALSVSHNWSRYRCSAILTFNVRSVHILLSFIHVAGFVTYYNLVRNVYFSACVSCLILIRSFTIVDVQVDVVISPGTHVSETASRYFQ
jgi:hypothetical protein